MKIPQLVQEIIDYYIYSRQWKARIRQVNEEYKGKYHLFDDDCVISLRVNKEPDRYFYYNWRNQFHYFEENVIYHPQVMSYYKKLPSQYDDSKPSAILCGVKLPSRYYYSNTQEQLKSLFLI